MTENGRNNVAVVLGFLVSAVAFVAGGGLAAGLLFLIATAFGTVATAFGAAGPGVGAGLDQESNIVPQILIASIFGVALGSAGFAYRWTYRKLMARGRVLESPSRGD